MAIDRDKAYYKQWTNDRNWILRFEIIPAGKFVDSSHNYQSLSWVAMKRGAINIKSQKTSFNKIPVGVMDASSITVDFDMLDLDANLIEILQQPFFDHTSEGLAAETTNLFILKSDRGTGVCNYIEFLGGQKNTLSNEYGLMWNGSAFVPQTVSIDAIDVFKLCLEQVTTAWWAENIITRGIAAETYFVPTRAAGLMYDFTVTDAASHAIAKYDYEVRADVFFTHIRLLGSSGVAVYMYQPTYMFTYGLLSAIQEYMAAWTRSGNPTTYNVAFNRHPFYPLTFYKGATVAETNAKGDALSDTSFYVIGKTTSLTDETKTYGGMLIADKGGESYLAYPYLWDLLKNVCEGSCSKLIYRPKLVANTTGAVMDLSYELFFERIFHNPSNTTQDLSDRFADAHGEKTFKFAPCSGVYTSATAEIPNEGGTDLDHVEAQILGTMSDERVNAQMIHHNNPTGDGIVLGPNSYATEQRLHPRKLYYNTGSGSVFQKVHESVKIHDQITETTYDNPLPIEYTGSLEAIAAYATASQQQNGLPYAAANFYLNRFSDASQNEIKCTMYMIDGETMPENVGDTVTIPSFTGFASSTTATIIEAEANWNKGTVDLTFITRGV